MASAVHFWIAFVATGVLLVVLAWAGSRRRKLGPKQLAGGNYPAACGSCGYDLTGLPGTTCPECGSDLELVGRLSPQFHRWAAVPVTARLIVWTVAVGAMGAGFALVGAGSAIGRVQYFDAYIQRAVLETIRAGNEDHGPISYPAMTLVARGHFVRPAPVGEAMPVGHGSIAPSEQTQWEWATLEIHLRNPPVVEGSGYYWLPGRELRGSAQVDIEPGRDGSPVISQLSVLAFDSDGENDLAAALTRALAQAGYAGEYGEPADLVSTIAPTINSFLELGAPTVIERQSPWSERFSGNNRSYSMGIGAPALTPTPFAVLGLASLVAWALGLPFILRKRPISIRRERDEVPAEPMIPQAGAGVLESAHAGQA